MRIIATVVAAAFAVANAGQASAATYYNNIVANVGGSFGNDDPITYAPHFNDNYAFVTNYDRTATVEILSSMSTAKAWKENVNFISNGVKLDAKIIPATSTGQYERRYLANFRIPAGVHNIQVRGSSAEDGKYSGFLTLAGVPEPSTWSLMILGFGLTGAAMRRRTAKAKLALA
jgi:hypothetical protein